MTTTIYDKIDTFVLETTPAIISRMELENLHTVNVHGGKKLRGNLTMLVARALGGDLDIALDYAAAVEFIHAGSLEHDDVLDGHDERRGKPTHAFIEGIQKAILTGDIMFCAANRVASENGNKAAIAVADAMQSTLDGVLKEMNVDRILQDALTGKLERDLYKNIIDRKTGTLFACAAKFGAMSFDENDNIVDIFERYGMSLGEGYQIADDIVDIVEMSEGTKEVTPLSVIGVLPALLNYEGNLLKRLPMMMLRKNFDITTLLNTISDVNIETKMMDDTKQCIKECDTECEFFNDDDTADRAEYIEMLRAYPTYAINMMLREIGEKI
jgi:geranylgeranyl pyrophosphate synthase